MGAAPEGALLPVVVGGAAVMATTTVSSGSARTTRHLRSQLPAANVLGGAAGTDLSTDLLAGHYQRRRLKHLRRQVQAFAIWTMASRRPWPSRLPGWWNGQLAGGPGPCDSSSILSARCRTRARARARRHPRHSRVLPEPAPVPARSPTTFAGEGVADGVEGGAVLAGRLAAAAKTTSGKSPRRLQRRHPRVPELA